MKIDKINEGSNIIINLEGRLDTNTAPELEKELSSLDGIQNLIFDFKNLEYISSAGLRIILNSQKVMNKQGSMIIKNARDIIKDIFEIAGFLDILTLE